MAQLALWIKQTLIRGIKITAKSSFRLCRCTGGDGSWGVWWVRTNPHAPSSLCKTAAKTMKQKAKQLSTLVHRGLYVEAPSYLAELVVLTSIQQQSWSELSQVVLYNRYRTTWVSTVSVHRCATYSLDTRRPRVLRRSASSLEQPSPHIRHISSMDVFSKNLKSFLFSRAF